MNYGKEIEIVLTDEGTALIRATLLEAMKQVPQPKFEVSMENIDEPSGCVQEKSSIVSETLS